MITENISAEDDQRTRNPPYRSVRAESRIGVLEKQGRENKNRKQELCRMGVLMGETERARARTVQLAISADVAVKASARPPHRWRAMQVEEEL